ncbi:putative protein N(5)-glutamine methyltransferase [Rhodococcus olei]|uniref:peptide chain release factor N(5)-glutamine methyltransferase n=1 Tax=Rhodococcus olei TaxID=2161675 RepID=A0ABP8NX87_9NOCA
MVHDGGRPPPGAAHQNSEVPPTSTQSPTPTDVIATLRSAGCVFAEDEARLLLDAARDGAQLTTMVQERVSGRPLEQILGWAEFCGLRVAVEPGVFVPRRRTEFLVRQAAALLATDEAVVVDLCCGSGAVAAALASASRSIVLHASDIDPVAARCAERNLAPGAVHCGDLYDALPADLRGRVDLLVVNAPYVPSDAIATMPPEARLHEPHGALDGGADGVDVHRRVAAGAPEWLAPGGHLLIETSEHQADLTAEACARAGLAPRPIHCPELGATVVVAAAPGAGSGPA